MMHDEMKRILMWKCMMRLEYIWVTSESDLNKRSESDLSWVKIMKIELNVLDLDIETSHTTIYVILRRQSWRDDIHRALAHNYSEDEKTLK